MPVSIEISEYMRTLQAASVKTMTPKRLKHLKRIAKMKKPRKNDAAKIV